MVKANSKIICVNKNSERGNRGKTKTRNKQKTARILVDFNPNISIITLNMKDLRSLFKNRDCQKWIGLKQKNGKYIIKNIKKTN